MRRARSTEDIRADAIKMAIKKGTEGCHGCAQSYFDLARKHGATEEEIQQTIEISPTLNSDLSRRGLFKLAAVGAARLAVLSAAGGLIPQIALQTAAAQTADGAQVAWAKGDTPTGAQELIGIAPAGGIVGQIDVSDKYVLRAPDGGVLYAVSARKSGATSAALIEAYSATTGVLQNTVTGRPLAVGNERGFDALAATISTDGRYLVLLHQTSFVTPTGNQITKVDAAGQQHTIFVDNITVINGVEIIDLTAARTLDYLQLDASPDNLVGGTIEVAPDNKGVYAFTLTGSLVPVATAVQFDGQTLRGRARVSNGQNGHVVPAGGPGFRSAARIRPDSQTLVQVVSSTVQWFDLNSSTLTGSLDVSQPARAGTGKPSPMGTLFSPDGSMLYVTDAASDTIQAIDLANHVRSGSSTLPTQNNPAAVSAGAAGGTALSPDGKYLYVISGRGGDGFFIVRAVDLSVVGHALPGVYVRALWPSPDAQTIFAAGLADGRVYTTGNDGQARNATQTGVSLVGFVG